MTEMSREEWENLLEEHGDRVAGIAAEVKASVAEQLAGIRTPSKAHQIGSPSRHSGGSGYAPGSFIEAVSVAGDPHAFPEARTQAKATLEALTMHQGGWGDAARISYSADGEAAWSKATLATTDATGGWIVPNALVDEIVKPAVQEDPYRALVTVVPGVTAFQVDLPWRASAPSRMTIASRGATKENVDLTYNGYTVTMYTLARIHDVANQFLRQSAGAAERDVLGELASAATLGERYYIIAGSGSSEPYGLQTALTNSAYSNEAGSYSAAATLAGSISAAIGVAAGNLADRSVEPTAAVMHTGTYWRMLREGSNEAGFYFNGDLNRNTVPGLAGNVLISRFGIPVIPDASLAETDDLIVGNFKALKLYLGDAFRVESSSIAGTRWDENETGFRGEFEMGLDARPAVYTGNFTRIQDVVP